MTSSYSQHSCLQKPATTAARNESTLTGAYSHIQAWTIWDPRERMKMDTWFRMRVYDILLNFLVFTPLIVLHNQAANGMLDFILLNRFPTSGAWFLLFYGISVEFLLCFFHKWLLKKVPMEQEIYPIMASHLYIYLLTFANICHMRAIVDLYSIYIGEDCYSAIKACCTGLAALVGLKCIKNILAPPLILMIDSHKHEEVFETPTLFATEADLSPDNALDSLATVGVVHTFVHLFWFGWWAFLDTWLFPDSPALSSLFSISLGYLGCLVSILFHTLACQMLQKLENDKNQTACVAFEDAYHIFAGTSVIALWRGLWTGFNVLGNYFPIFYKGRDVTYVVAHIISFALLALANVSMSLPDKGVDIDGKETAGEALVCHIDYFCEYFKEELEEEQETRRKPEYKHKPVAMVTGNQILNGTPTLRHNNAYNDDLIKEELKEGEFYTTNSAKVRRRGKKKE